MNTHPLRNAVIVTITCIAVLWLYEQFARPLQTRTQSAFEGWLSVVEADFIREKDAALPHVRVHLYAPGDTSFDLRAESGSGHAEDAHLLRILSQIREADIFGAKAEPLPGEPAIVVEIESEGNKFVAPVARDAFEQSVKARLLLKLFELYGDISRPQSRTTSAPPADIAPQEVEQ